MIRWAWKRIAARLARPDIEPEVVAWHGIGAVKNLRPIGEVTKTPYVRLEELKEDGYVAMMGQSLAELKDYPQLVEYMESEGWETLPDRRILI